MSEEPQRRATVVGTGLIGASVGLGLRAHGWHVSGLDLNPELLQRAIDLGACDTEGYDSDADLVVIATPVGVIVDETRRALAACPRAAVTDVGGVKASIVGNIDDPRFVGGHPMAGSEEPGLDGASRDLFDGATWVLCPGPSTADGVYAMVRETVDSLGALVLTLSPDDHDRMVAVVSHVPHLTAASLVRIADAHASEHVALLRLAAGGFRDMTRVAAGSPSIWPSVCSQNREAILGVLDQLVSELSQVRSLVADDDAATILGVLSEAQQVRRNLPTRPSADVPRSEVRALIADRPGALAAVAGLATDIGVNLMSFNSLDLEDGRLGFAVLGVATDDAERLRDYLVEAGYRAFVTLDTES